MKDKLKTADGDELVMSPLDASCLVHMSVNDWMAAVNNGIFSDYEGHGQWATDTMVSNERVNPSDLSRPGFAVPEWATHVVWFNK